MHLILWLLPLAGAFFFNHNHCFGSYLDGGERRRRRRRRRR